MVQETMARQVDGDKLAAALRRLTPFMYEGEDRANLNSVYAESHGGILELTACDGFRLAHATLTLDFPEGNFVLKADGIKDFSQRHYNGQEISVEPQTGQMKMGDVAVAIIGAEYPDYGSLVPDTYEAYAIIETKRWIKAIRAAERGTHVVGVVYSPQGCRLYFESAGGETTSREDVPVQMFDGEERRVAYHADRLRRALTSCGAECTIKVAPEGKTLFETEDYWHFLMPTAGFPREVNLTGDEKAMVRWAEDALAALRKGEIPGKVMVGGGRFYLELSEERTETEVILETPHVVQQVVLQPGEGPVEVVVGDQGDQAGEDEAEE